MKVLGALCLSAVLLAGCGPPKNLNFDGTMHIINENNTDGYSIGQRSPTHFYVYAPSPSAANRIADTELNCRTRTCLIRPLGVVIEVERPLDPTDLP